MTSSLEDLLWFETLNLPLFANQTLIKLNSGEKTGFLLRETEFSFDIQYLSLGISHVIKHPQGTEWIEKNQFDTQFALKESLWASLPEEIQKQILEYSVTYYVPSLSLVCKAWFLCIHRGENFVSRFFGETSYSVCDVRSTVEAAAASQIETFPRKRHDEESYVLAWLASKHDMLAEAAKLMKKPKGHIKTVVPVRLLWLIVLEIGEAKVPLQKLLSELKFLDPFYPRDDHHYAQLLEYIAVIEKMLVEEKEHDARMTGKIFAELSEDEQIEELIYQLRTQNGHQMCQPGSCDLLCDRRKNNPLKQLIKRGYSAVPKLIQHLEDKTLTRSVGYHRDFYFSHHVLRVGDCCLKAINNITNKAFYERKTTNSYASSENQLTSIKEQAEQWWRDFNSKGKKQMCIEQILAFEYTEAETTAREFVKEFPSGVLALFNTVFDGRECAVADVLFTILAEVEPQSPEILALLHKEFAFRPSVPKAMTCLNVKDFDLTAVNEFILQQFPLCLSDQRRDDFENAVDYIARMDLKDGLRLMIETVPNIPRTYLVKKVCEAIVRRKPVSWGSTLQTLKHPKESFEIIYACLRQTRRANPAELRICDEIAQSLAENNKKYQFSALTSEENRDLQIRKIVSLLRRDNGELDESMDVDVPLPNSDEIPLGQVYTLLCKYVEAKHAGDERCLALEGDIKGHGFKIIPAMGQFIAQSQNDGDKDIMRALARHMAFKIQSVSVLGRTTAALDALLAPLRQMRDFSYKAVLQVARSVALAKIEYSVYIQYARFQDQLGVNIRVEIGETKVANSGYWDNSLVYNGSKRHQSFLKITQNLTAQQLKEYMDLFDGFTYNTPFVGFLTQNNNS